MLSKIFQALFIIFIIVIEYLATTSVQIEPIENSWDKANHFVAFLALYVTLSMGYTQMSLKSKVLLLLVFATQIEIVQAFLPNREFSLLDIVADGLGILFGIVVLKYYTAVVVE